MDIRKHLCFKHMGTRQGQELLVLLNPHTEYDRITYVESDSAHTGKLKLERDVDDCTVAIELSYGHIGSGEPQWSRVRKVVKNATRPSAQRQPTVDIAPMLGGIMDRLSKLEAKE